MTITFSQHFLVWVSFLALMMAHVGIAAACRLYKHRNDALGTGGFLHTVVTLLYAGFYPVWFPQGIY